MNSVSGSVGGSANGVDWSEIFERYGFDTPDAVGNLGAYSPQLRAILEVEGVGWDAVRDALEGGELVAETRETQAFPGSEKTIERTVAIRCPDIEVQQ